MRHVSFKPHRVRWQRKINHLAQKKEKKTIIATISRTDTVMFVFDFKISLIDEYYLRDSLSRSNYLTSITQSAGVSPIKMLLPLLPAKKTEGHLSVRLSRQGFDIAHLK